MSYLIRKETHQYIKDYLEVHMPSDIEKLMVKSRLITTLAVKRHIPSFIWSILSWSDVVFDKIKRGNFSVLLPWKKDRTSELSFLLADTEYKLNRFQGELQLTMDVARAKLACIDELTIERMLSTLNSIRSDLKAAEDDTGSYTNYEIMAEEAEWVGYTLMRSIKHYDEEL